MRIKFWCVSLMVLGFALLARNVFADNGIAVADAWVQAVPPSANTTAAYLTLTNNSSQEEVLVSASSDAAAASEVHQMNEANGMMRMAMVQALHIAPQQKIVFAPGGLHIMLINLKKPLKAGDVVAIKLNFKDGSSSTFNATVKSQDDSSASQSMGGMNGMKM